MPYNIADPNQEMDALVVRNARVFIEKNRINLLTGHRVTAIDRKGRRVTGVRSGEEPFDFEYDKLLIATGAAPVIPDLPGIDLPQVMVLKNLEHGRQIRRYLEQNHVKTAVIMGMGYIALEMCEAFEKRGIQTTMVKPGPVFMPWLSPPLADVIHEELTRMGVTLYPGHAVQQIDAAGSGVRLVCDDFNLEADMVLCARGVTPCSRMAEAAGLDLGISDAVSVDRCLKTSDKDIYAAGDCADAYHLVTGDKCWIPLALRANRAGWAVADNVCGIETRLAGVVGTAVFRVFSLEVARSGLTVKEAKTAGFDPVENHVKTRSRAHGHPGSTPIYINMIGDKKSGRLLGVQMVGKEGVAHRVNAAAVALHNRMTVEKFSETDLAYAPPFGPVWDPLLTAANQLMKKLS
jgi:NADPH-dependent 2,4-dienoyl-CoA reductase/sulfur reductase-like enzyme